MPAESEVKLTALNLPVGPKEMERFFRRLAVVQARRARRQEASTYDAGDDFEQLLEYAGDRGFYANTEGDEIIRPRGVGGEKNFGWRVSAVNRESGKPISLSSATEGMRLRLHDGSSENRPLADAELRKGGLYILPRSRGWTGKAQMFGAGAEAGFMGLVRGGLNILGHDAAAAEASREMHLDSLDWDLGGGGAVPPPIRKDGSIHLRPEHLFNTFGNAAPSLLVSLATGGTAGLAAKGLGASGGGVRAAQVAGSIAGEGGQIFGDARQNVTEELKRRGEMEPDEIERRANAAGLVSAVGGAATAAFPFSRWYGKRGGGIGFAGYEFLQEGAQGGIQQIAEAKAQGDEISGIDVANAATLEAIGGGAAGGAMSGGRNAFNLLGRLGGHRGLDSPVDFVAEQRRLKAEAEAEAEGGDSSLAGKQMEKRARFLAEEASQASASGLDLDTYAYSRLPSELPEHIRLDSGLDEVGKRERFSLELRDMAESLRRAPADGLKLTTERLVRQIKESGGIEISEDQAGALGIEWIDDGEAAADKKRPLAEAIGRSLDGVAPPTEAAAFAFGGESAKTADNSALRAGEGKGGLSLPSLDAVEKAGRISREELRDAVKHNSKTAEERKFLKPKIDALFAEGAPKKIDGAEFAQITRAELSELDAQDQPPAYKHYIHGPAQGWAVRDIAYHPQGKKIQSAHGGGLFYARESTSPDGKIIETANLQADPFQHSGGRAEMKAKREAGEISEQDYFAHRQSFRRLIGERLRAAAESGAEKYRIARGATASKAQWGSAAQIMHHPEYRAFRVQEGEWVNGRDVRNAFDIRESINRYGYFDSGEDYLVVENGENYVINDMAGVDSIINELREGMIDGEYALAYGSRKLEMDVTLSNRGDIRINEDMLSPATAKKAKAFINRENRKQKKADDRWQIGDRVHVWGWAEDKPAVRKLLEIVLPDVKKYLSGLESGKVAIKLADQFSNQFGIVRWIEMDNDMGRGMQFIADAKGVITMSPRTREFYEKDIPALLDDMGIAHSPATDEDGNKWTEIDVAQASETPTAAFVFGGENAATANHREVRRVKIIEARALRMVRQIAGNAVGVKILSDNQMRRQFNFPPNEQAPAGAHEGDQIYLNGRHLAALGKFDPQVPAHEAFEAIWGILPPSARATLESTAKSEWLKNPRLRLRVEKSLSPRGLKISDDEASVREAAAYAFQEWTAGKYAALENKPLSAKIRTLFVKMRRFLRGMTNLLRLSPWAASESAEDIFERAHAGDFAFRMKPDQTGAAVRLGDSPSYSSAAEFSSAQSAVAEMARKAGGKVKAATLISQSRALENQGKARPAETALLIEAVGNNKIVNGAEVAAALDARTAPLIYEITDESDTQQARDVEDIAPSRDERFNAVTTVVAYRFRAHNPISRARKKTNREKSSHEEMRKKHNALNEAAERNPEKWRSPQQQVEIAVGRNLRSDHFVLKNQNNREAAFWSRYEDGRNAAREPIRRIVEIQSDIWSEQIPKGKNLPPHLKSAAKQYFRRAVDEEIARAQRDGIAELHFPSWQTAAKTQGFIANDDTEEGIAVWDAAEIQNAEIGDAVNWHGDDWIVTGRDANGTFIGYFPDGVRRDSDIREGYNDALNELLTDEEREEYTIEDHLAKTILGNYDNAHMIDEIELPSGETLWTTGATRHEIVAPPKTKDSEINEFRGFQRTILTHYRDEGKRLERLYPQAASEEIHQGGEGHLRLDLSKMEARTPQFFSFAKGADGQIAKAEEMKTAGESPDTIWRATRLVHEPNENEWLREISPGRLRKKAVEDFYNRRRKSFKASTRLGDIYDAPALYRRFPELRNVEVREPMFMMDGGGFGFRDGKPIIILGYLTLAYGNTQKQRERYQRWIDAEKAKLRDWSLPFPAFASPKRLRLWRELLKEAGNRKTKEKNKATLLDALEHEIQHYLDWREGRSAGASANAAAVGRIELDAAKARKMWTNSAEMAGLEGTEKREFRKALDKHLSGSVATLENMEALLSEIPLDKQGRVARTMEIQAYLSHFGEVRASESGKRSLMKYRQRKGLAPTFESQTGFLVKAEQKEDETQFSIPPPAAAVRGGKYDSTKDPALANIADELKDKNGKPRVFYHGTAAQFSEFVDTAKGESTSAESAKMAWWMVSGKSTAAEFARFHSDGKGEATAENERVLRLIPIVKNPLVIDKHGQVWDMKGEIKTPISNKIIEETAGVFSESKRMKSAYPGMTASAIRAYVKKIGGDRIEQFGLVSALSVALANGNDGVIFENMRDPDYAPPERFVAVFSASQIINAETGERMTAATAEKAE